MLSKYTYQMTKSCHNMFIYTLVHSRNTGGSLSWLYCDNSYIASSASHSDVSALLVCTALHPQITRRHCSKFSVVPLSMSTPQNSSTVTESISFWFTQARWQVAGQLQIHCLCRLNPFIPCVCAFTYLSSLIIFTVDMSSSSMSSHPRCLQL